MKKIDFYVSYFERLGENISHKTINFLPSFVFAIVVFVLSKWLIRFLLSIIKKSLLKYEVDPSLAVFFRSVIKFILNVLLVISVVAILGFPTTSFIAILSAAGLAVGLALQGSLSNFAGGVLILFFKPFKIGDSIESNNASGIVTRIDIMHTTIHTGENKVIIMPNGYLANNNIINATRENNRRIEFKISIDYASNFQEVRKIILKVLKEDKRIHADPLPIIVLNNLGEYSLDIIIRCWTDTPIWSEVYWENLEKIKSIFDATNIKFPIPKREIKLQNT